MSRLTATFLTRSTHESGYLHQVTLKISGSRDPGHAPFSINFKGSCPDCPWKQVTNLKSTFNRYAAISI